MEFNLAKSHGMLPVNRFEEISSFSSAGRVVMLCGMLSVKLLLPKSSSRIAREVAFVGKAPVKLLLASLTTVKFWGASKSAGTMPLSALLLQSSTVIDTLSGGRGPVKLLFASMRVCRRGSWVNAGGKLPLKLLEESETIFSCWYFATSKIGPSILFPAMSRTCNATSAWNWSVICPDNRFLLRVEICQLDEFVKCPKHLLSELI